MIRVVFRTEEVRWWCVGGNAMGLRPQGIRITSVVECSATVVHGHVSVSIDPLSAGTSVTRLVEV